MPDLADPAPLRPGALRWADLRPRVLSAGILVPLALVCWWYGGFPWTLLLAAAATGLVLEWLRLCGEPHPTVASVTVLASVLAALLMVQGEHGSAALACLGIGTVATLVLRRSLRLALGVIYVGLGAVALVWLRQADPDGQGNVLYLLLVVWGSDIGAYAVGRLIGGPKLAPAISPGKTWSGAVGGLVVAMLAGWVAAMMLTGPPALMALPVAAALSVVSQLGDLLESALKRRFGVKDSGQLIPGHGGLLDRLDGLMTAAPAAALLALWLGRGVVLWQ